MTPRLLRVTFLLALLACLTPTTAAKRYPPVKPLITRPGDMSCPRGCWYDIDCVCCECPVRGK